MTPKEIFKELQEHITDLVDQTPKGKKLFKVLATLHPADITQLIEECSPQDFKTLFSLFTEDTQKQIFEHLPESYKALALGTVNDKQRIAFLENMSMDEISDLVDFTSDEELKSYFNLLQKKDREKVIKLLQLKPNSVGTVMELNVVSFQENFTVEKSIHILQRLRPNQELHQKIYITDNKNKLVGYIGLEDLVLQKPQTYIKDFMKKNIYVAKVEDDQEQVAQQMRHYQLVSAPVVGRSSYFLGAVTSTILIDILEEEAGEDILRISAMTRLKYTYFDTPFVRLLAERGAILVVLMIAESLTSFIIGHYEVLLINALTLFIPMLISTGGNTSTQTSAIVVQGIASGEIHSSNVKRFLRRELSMSTCLALLLGITAFLRVFYIGHQSIMISLAVGTAIGAVVMISTILGSSVPFILRKIGLDPAYAAAPFLATGMDILGILVYCYISKMILSM